MMKTMVSPDEAGDNRAPSPKKRSRGRNADLGDRPDDAEQTPTLVSYETGDTIDEEEEDSEGESGAFAVNGAKQNGKKVDEESGVFGTKKKDVPWDSENFASAGDDDWGVQQDFGNDESPGTWDPDSFVKQTVDLDRWKEVEKKELRLQDLPSPSLAQPPPDHRTHNSDEEEWPFKSPCKFHGKSGRSRTPRSGQSARSGYGSASDIDSSVGSSSPVRGALGGTVAAEEAERGYGGKGDKAKEAKASKPKRSSGRPDAEEGDAPPTRPKVNDGDKPLKPTRRSKSKDRSDQEELDEDEEILDDSSFHNIAENMDKPRSRSKGRKPSKDAKPLKRRSTNKDPSPSGGAPGHYEDDDLEGFKGEETDYRLKGEDDVAPGSGGSGRKAWRQRRAENRSKPQRSMSTDSGPVSQLSEARSTIDAPGSAGRRPPSSRRAMMRRAQSERWMKNVDTEQSDDADAIARRAKNSLATAELSRSAHSVRRYKSGGLEAMTGEPPRQRTPSSGDRAERRRRRKEDQLGTASYHGVHDLSGRSQRTMESIEDFEDFGHKDFQTPGMVDIDDEIYEMMLRANPENTNQLDKRVHRQRGKMHYDQNMPLMTRQALLTRQASSIVNRGRVDASNVDRRRLLLRNNSDASMGSKNDDLSFSQHRAAKYGTGAGPGASMRKAPPRSRSSGLAAMAAQTMQQPVRDEADEHRRKLFRHKSTSSNGTRQMQGKPNRVASLPRPPTGAGGAEVIVSSSIRDSVVPERERKPIQRAKSTNAIARRPQRSDVRPTRVESRVRTDDDSIDSQGSDISSGESMEGDKSPGKKLVKLKPPKSVTPKKPSRLLSPVPKPKTQGRDLARRSHRRVLHALLYESKMGVNLKELVKQSNKPDSKKDEPAALLITAP